MGGGLVDRLTGGVSGTVIGLPPPPRARVGACDVTLLSSVTKGRGLFESRHTHTPLQTPKFSKPAFCNLRFWGKLLAL